MKTKASAILLMFLTTLLTSTAQFLYKKGIPALTFDFFAIITNGYLIGGLALYAVGAGIMIIALRGGELSVLYPIIATSYIWVGILSHYFFNEDLNIFRWLGIFAIVIGIACIGFGSKQAEAIV